MPGASGLSALDDFEQPACPVAAPKATAAKISAPASSLRPKQRVVVAHDKFARVTGRGNCNLRAIEEVTGARLEVEDKRIPPNQDRSILLRGDSLEVTRYAFELLQALIDDCDGELLDLLPGSRQTASSGARAKQTAASKASGDAVKVSGVFC